MLKKLVILSLSLAFVGCASKEKKEEAQTPPTISADSIQNVPYDTTAHNESTVAETPKKQTKKSVSKKKRRYVPEK